jgi:pheromone receptor transcription factor
MTAAVLKAEDPLMSAFAPAEGSYPIQTPYGSIQLNHASAQQTPAITFLGVPGADSDEEEEEDDDDDEDGTSKGKRKRSKSTSSKSGGKKTAAKGAAASSAAGVGTSGERDSHTGRRKIRIEFIEDDSRRHITFSKRKAGIMKKVSPISLTSRSSC